MKKGLVLTLAIGLVLVWGGAAMAADTNTLTVNASVSPTCKFSSLTSTLDFGALDPNLTTAATKQATVTYWCTRGTTAGVTANNGSHASGTQKRMVNSTDATAFINYSLALTGGTQQGGGKNTPRTLTLDGTIINSDYVDALVGSYSDQVTLTLNP